MIRNEPETGERWVSFGLNRAKLHQVRRREGGYLHRFNLATAKPVTLWELYLQLVDVEQAFKDLKGDLHLRPIWDQLDNRIDAHIFISFLAYCLHVTLRNVSCNVAPGLTPNAIIQKLCSIQMIDVHLPTTDDREIVLSRYTQSEKDVALLLAQLAMALPPPPPRISAKGSVTL